MSEKNAFECLRCGTFRTGERDRTEPSDPGDCPRCGYAGWALAADLTDPARRTLRDQAPERRGRRLHAV